MRIVGVSRQCPANRVNQPSAGGVAESCFANASIASVDDGCCRGLTTSLVLTPFEVWLPDGFQGAMLALRGDVMNKRSKLEAPDVMNVAEAAAYLRVIPQTILRQLRKGALPGIKVGSRWRLSRLALEDRLGQVAKPAVAKPKRKAKARRKATRQ